MLTLCSRTHQPSLDKQTGLTCSWECTSSADAPPPTAKTSLFLFFYVSFPSSSVSGLLLGTLRRRGDEREPISGENQQLNEGGPVLSSPQWRAITGMKHFQSGMWGSGSSGSHSPSVHKCIAHTHTHLGGYGPG